MIKSHLLKVGYLTSYDIVCQRPFVRIFFAKTLDITDKARMYGAIRVFIARLVSVNIQNAAMAYINIILADICKAYRKTNDFGFCGVDV